MKRFNDQSGVVGLIVLALISLVFIGLAVSYVASVRSGHQQPLVQWHTP